MPESEYDNSSLNELDANEFDVQESHPSSEGDNDNESLSILFEEPSVIHSDKLDEGNTLDLSTLMSNYASLDDFLMQGKPLRSVELSTPKEEFYEVFPYNGSQGDILKFIHKSLTLALQKYMETCLPTPVHQFSLESEDLFTYMIPMHRKRVQL
jgi:hypothetical protein